MPEWVVVLLALAAAVTSALGIVIRQRATLAIPQDEGVSSTMFKKLLRNRLWWYGTAVAAAGYGFQALALTWGSLILVVPLLVSALLFARNLLVLHRSPAAAGGTGLYALAVHPPQRVPAALNGFGLWNVLVAVLMLAAYGFPIAQFIITPSPSAIVHRVE